LISSATKLLEVAVLVLLVVLMGVILGSVSGCSRSPTRIEAPAWDPEGFADAIITKLDKSADGSLDKSELSAAPGLAWGAKHIDRNKDDKLTPEELVERFTLYEELRLGLTRMELQLVYQSKPLADAKVRLVPEFFLTDIIEPASGDTYADGRVDPLIPDMDPPGLRVGYYRVVVESPRVKIPAKYASAETTTLGIEVSPISDDPESDGMIRLVL
jgi:hypothetical protein